MSLLSKLRTVFTLGKGVVTGLSEHAAGPDPIVLFDRWFADAKRSGMLLPETMALATSAADGTPAARMVLLKAFDDRGFVFYTNYVSRKSWELDENPNAALLLFWSILERQVRIEGVAERISAEESAAYFSTRPRGSQLGAWASKQSMPLEDPETLGERFKKYEQKFSGGDVPSPDFWGGFRVVPHTMEFWQGRLNRLHDRVLYKKEDGKWVRSRLYP
jgi:pyridoxamine 5'-phosphate oxidase